MSFSYSYLLVSKNGNSGVLGTSKDTFTSGNVIKQSVVEIETIMATLVCLSDFVSDLLSTCGP